MSGTEEKKVTLTHHKTGEKREFTLRPFCCDDVKAVIQCVKDEYDDTYYRREYYDEKLLVEMTESGGLYLYLACCGDELCGIQSIVSHAPEDTRLEAASQIFRKKFRGYGLPYELVKYTYDVARSLSPSSIYASTVVFHNITASMCEDAGMVPVAFNLGSHITSKMHNSYMLGNSEKYAQAILILPVAKKDAGTVYVHSDIAGVVNRLYLQLGVKADIKSTYQATEDAAHLNPAALKVSVNEREQSVSIRVVETGSDLITRVREIMSSYTGELWTFQLILPVDEPCAIREYEELVKEGFFFAGLRPLCCEKEQIFMQNIRDVRFNFDEYVLTDRFRALLEEIQAIRGKK